MCPFCLVNNFIEEGYLCASSAHLGVWTKPLRSWCKIKPNGSLASRLLPLVVPKGYIAVDGTSLTVCEVNRAEGWFNLMLIQHTQQCVA